MRSVFSALAGLGFLLTAPAGAVDLAAHVAHYKLSLQTSKGDIESAKGDMTYEVIDACDGWAVRQRLDMQLTSRDGQDVHSVADYTIFESKDGRQLRFRSNQNTEGESPDVVAGEARLAEKDGSGEVVYTQPEAATKKLPAGTLFPMHHSIAFLDAAQHGKKFLSLPTFDGTSAAGVQSSSIVMSGWSGAPAETKFAPLAALPSGKVHIAFFDGDSDGAQPDYEVSMRYWSNGVADQMAMDFGDFVMMAKIDKLVLTKPGC